jgi:hypothetical protein
MAAPAGNQNAKKGRMFEQALVRAIKQRDITAGDGETLRAVAEALLTKAIDGDITAAKEIRDTLDGKPKQQTEISGPDGGPVEVSRIELIPLSGYSPSSAAS